MKPKTHIYNFLAFFRSFIMAAVVTTLSTGITSCSNEQSQLWNEVPAEISRFINDYYPNSALDAVTFYKDIYHIRLKNGPGLTFNDKEQWITVNGYGMPLPEVLLFDQLPPSLFSYLQETEQLGSVFSLSRNKNIYTVTLLSRSLRFNASTEELIGEESAGNGQSTPAAEN